LGRFAAISPHLFFVPDLVRGQKTKTTRMRSASRERDAPSINTKIAAPRFLNQGQRAPADFAQFREHDFFFAQKFRIDRDGVFMRTTRTSAAQAASEIALAVESVSVFFVKILFRRPDHCAFMIIT